MKGLQPLRFVSGYDFTACGKSIRRGTGSGPQDLVRRKHARRQRAAGSDVQLYRAGRAGAEGSSAAGDPGDDGRVVAAPGYGVRADVCAGRSAVDCAGEAAAGAVAAGALFGAFGAAADGAAELQPAVPLVRGAEHGRPGVGRDGVYEEPGAADRGRCVGAAVAGGGGTGAVGKPGEGGARHGGPDGDPRGG